MRRASRSALVCRRTLRFPEGWFSDFFGVCAYPMAARVHVHGLSVRLEGDSALVSVGREQVWEGADLSLLRDTVRRLVEDGSRSIGIDLSGVQYLPSGFFGLLMDWSDRGVSISLVAPHEQVQKMMWFTEFFHEDHIDSFSLRPEGGTLRFGGRGLERTQPAAVLPSAS